MAKPIPCSKRFPANRSHVLAWDQYDECWRVAIFYMFDGKRHEWEDYFNGESLNDHRITHWTNLPRPIESTADGESEHG